MYTHDPSYRLRCVSKRSISVELPLSNENLTKENLVPIIFMVRGCHLRELRMHVARIEVGVQGMAVPQTSNSRTVQRSRAGNELCIHPDVRVPHQCYDNWLLWSASMTLSCIRSRSSIDMLLPALEPVLPPRPRGVRFFVPACVIDPPEALGDGDSWWDPLPGCDACSLCCSRGPPPVDGGSSLQSSAPPPCRTDAVPAA
eukprot:m.450492 g.450492  ORF g.450492 m.450492 type:complete len:200 (+) comp21512_c0_seq24:250-849(+)